MIYRCTNPKGPGWKNYGGRGIKVCDRWRNSFELFFADVGLKPSPELTLERIDNEGNYEPGNVKWATRSEQNLNKRRKSNSPCPYIYIRKKGLRFNVFSSNGKEQVGLGGYATYEEAMKRIEELAEQWGLI